MIRSLESLIKKIKFIPMADLRLRETPALRTKEEETSLEVQLKEMYSFDSSRYGNSYSDKMAYASSILLLDLLHKCFNRAEVDLPEETSVLEIGVGNWNYVQALYKFIQVHSRSENVHIRGIDYFNEPGKNLSGLEGVEFSHADFFDLSEEPKYDLVLANHPLATKERYESWRIPYRPLDEFWARTMGMLKPGGILFGTGYLFNEGASAFNSFPKDDRIFRTHYYSPFKTINGIDPTSIKGFDENAVMMARKAA